MLDEIFKCHWLQCLQEVSAACSLQSVLLLMTTHISTHLSQLHCYITTLTFIMTLLLLSPSHKTCQIRTFLFPDDVSIHFLKYINHKYFSSDWCFTVVITDCCDQWSVSGAEWRWSRDITGDHSAVPGSSLIEDTSRVTRHSSHDF